MESRLVTGVAVVVAVYCVSLIWRRIAKHRKLSGFPTIGPSGILTSYIGALRFYKHGREIAQKGYDKYRGSIFKIPMLTQWMVVVTGPQMIEDVRHASDDQLSSKDAIAETLHLDILFGRGVLNNDFHVDVIRSQLTRNITARFSDIQDEITAAFADYVPIKGNEWTTVVMRDTIPNIVCRAVNRFLVGLPLCRDPDYRSLNVQFTFDIVTSGNVLNLFPTPLRHFIVRFLRKVPTGINRAIKHLEPLIKERLAQVEKYGEDWPDKPNDAISWFLEVAKEPHQRTVESFAIRILLMNFAGIHTTSQSFSNALFHLATSPEYVQPMREEVEAVINAEGWTKSAMGKLRKVDSFLKETQRVSGNGAFTVRRKVLKDFTFSNGTTVPAGCMIGIPHRSVHCDPDNYADPDVFDGFRFSKMREKEGESSKHSMVTLTHEYLSFGQGRHACPGRFFATNEVKAMLAYVLLNYDVKMANPGCPPELWFGLLSIPDPTAEVMFRKRMT